MKVEDWPPLNARVWLRLPCCSAEHPTRVEGTGADFVTVGAPSSPHTQQVAPTGDDEGFFLGWIMERGALEVPVALKEHADGPVPTWTLRQIGEAIATQRRSYVRLPISLDVRVFLDGVVGPTTVSTDDLSEGGIRFHAENWTTTASDGVFRVVVALNEVELELKGQVAWLGNPVDWGRRSVGVRFVDIQPVQADQIRAFVFAKEVERRRRSR